MSIFRSLEEVTPDIGRSAVSVGVFDGVHLGHRSLLAALRSEAARVAGKAVVLTFDRHPTELLAPERAPLYINTLDQKLSLLEEAGADLVVVGRFDHSLADLTPEQFVDDVLVARLKAAAVVVGANFRFGRKRSGDIARLGELGADRGFRVVGVEPAIVHGAPVSSTRVRNALERGDVVTAAALLGRPFTMLGSVVKGLGLGRRLGFPTANVRVAERQIVPKSGVYAVCVTIEGRRLPGVCSTGSRPTLGMAERSIEVCIDGFDGDAYGLEIEAEFHHRLRDEKRFDSLDALAAQIEKDAAEARSLLA